MFYVYVSLPLINSLVLEHGQSDCTTLDSEAIALQLYNCHVKKKSLVLWNQSVNSFSIAKTSFANCEKWSEHW